MQTLIWDNGKLMITLFEEVNLIVKDIIQNLLAGYVACNVLLIEVTCNKNKFWLTIEMVAQEL